MFEQNLCSQRLIEVGGTCTEAEDSERYLCGAIAGMAHREGGGGCGEGGDVKRTSQGPFHFVRSQGYTRSGKRTLRWASVQAVCSG